MGKSNGQRLFEHARMVGVDWQRRAAWDGHAGWYKEVWEEAYRFAHSEGAAEAGKRVAERVRQALSLSSELVRLVAFTQADTSPPARAARMLVAQLEALAAELEKR